MLLIVRRDDILFLILSFLLCVEYDLVSSLVLISIKMTLIFISI